MFGLTGETLASRVRASARAAGLGDRYNGTADASAWAPNATFQHQGR